MAIDVSREFEAELEGRLKSGRYRSVEELLREALHLVDERDEIREAWLKEWPKPTEENLLTERESSRKLENSSDTRQGLATEDERALSVHEVRGKGPYSRLPTTFPTKTQQPLNVSSMTSFRQSRTLSSFPKWAEFVRISRTAVTASGRWVGT